jgi:hypothetical protein
MHECRVITAHHEAGHAVAHVVRGGYVREIWTTHDLENPELRTLGGTWGEGTPDQHRAFTAFAGCWAETTWRKRKLNEDFHLALTRTWHVQAGGADVARYQEFRNYVDEPYRPPELHECWPGHPCLWEAEWGPELTRLWPAIDNVAEHLLNHQSVVTHDTIDNAVRWCLGT